MRFDARELWKLLWRNKWNFIIPILTIPSVAVTGSYFVQPLYKASAIVWVGESVGLTDDLKQLVGKELRPLQMVSRRDDTLSLKNELLSSVYIDQLIGDLKLNEIPELAARAQKNLARWPNLTFEKAMISAVQSNLEGGIDIRFVAHDQIRISLEYKDPYLARDIVQSLSKIFILEKSKQRMGILKASQDFLYGQLKRYSELLKENEKKQNELEKGYHTISFDSALITPENRRKISAEIDLIKSEIADEENLVQELSEKVSGLYAKEIEIKKSDELVRLEKETNNHLGSIGGLILKQKWDSPEILNFKARLNGYLDQIKDETEKLINKQFGDIDDSVRTSILKLSNSREYLYILISEKSYLTDAYENLQKKIGLLPEYQANLEQLQRERASIISMRDKLQEQQSSSSISQAILRESDFKILEPAMLPLRPFWPERGILITFGLFLALLIGGGVTIMVELSDRSYRKIDDVEKHLGLPVIGVVPRMSSIKVHQIGK